MVTQQNDNSVLLTLWTQEAWRRMDTLTYDEKCYFAASLLIAINDEHDTVSICKVGVMLSEMRELCTTDIDKDTFRLFDNIAKAYYILVEIMVKGLTASDEPSN